MSKFDATLNQRYCINYFNVSKVHSLVRFTINNDCLLWSLDIYSALNILDSNMLIFYGDLRPFLFVY